MGDTFKKGIKWASAPQDLPPVDIDAESIRSHLSFWYEASPLEVNGSVTPSTESMNRFTVRKIEERENEKILHGANVQAVLRGQWAVEKYRTGMCIIIIPCICCCHDNSVKSSLEDAEEYSSFSASVSESQDSDKDTASNRDEERSRQSAQQSAQQPGGCLHNLQSDGRLSSGFDRPVETFVVDNHQNYLVVEDDMLTVTTLCSGLECINNPYTRRLVADIGFDYSNSSLALGIVIHELIQTCLQQKCAAFPFVIATAKRIINRRGLLLYICNTTERKLLNEVLKHVKNIMDFVNRKMNVKSIEKMVFSRDLCLKGSVDCISDDFVIELKSGKFPDVSHRAQVLLYTLMVNLESPKKPYLPMLFYARSGEVAKVDFKHGEIASMLQMRNKIACNGHIVECNCPEHAPCARYNRVRNLPVEHFLRQQLEGIETEYSMDCKYIRCIKEEGTPGLSTVKLKFVDGFPNRNHVLIYSKDFKLLTRGEVKDMTNNTATVELAESMDMPRLLYISSDRCEIFYRYMRWSLLYLAYPRFQPGYPEEARKGFCLPGEAIASREDVENAASDDTGSISFSFDDLATTDREESAVRASLDTALGILSTDDMPPDACKLVPSWDEIEITSCEPDQKPADQERRAKRTRTQPDHTEDKENPNNAETDTQSPGKFTSPKPQILFNRPAQPNSPPPSVPSTESLPYFSLQRNSETQEFTTPIPEEFYDEFMLLNEYQRDALFQALNCKIYKVIHGMPGTGKSTLIALLIKILLHYKKKVLVICYTHLAIENIIKKIGSTEYYRANMEGLFDENKEVDENMLKNTIECTIASDKEQNKNIHKTRSGPAHQSTAPSRSPPTNHSASTALENNVSSIGERVGKIHLVFGTCFCFSDPVFINNNFDYCIIDEGSQMHLLLSLVPLHLCDRFCVVGDHLQLKPLAKKSKEMTRSIFELLMDKCAVLRIQYRMADEIMRLSNQLFYDGQLIGAGKHGMVEFIDIDSLNNYHEFIRKLGRCVILCYFHLTVRDIQPITQNHVTTIDKFQGSESDAIVVVFHPIKVCPVMESRDRLNVALTRAKKKLTLLGSRAEMAKIPVFRELLSMLTKRL